jgi:hypothetical protein
LTIAKFNSPLVDYQPEVEIEIDIDDIFFEKHGVGDAPVSAHGDVFDSNKASLIGLIDPMQATLHEIRFCKYLIKGETKRGSYIKAFELTGDEHPYHYYSKAADRLLKRPRVIIKYNEMRDKLVEFEEQEVADIIHELNEDRKLARDLGQPSAAIAAVKAKADILGITKKEKSNVNNINITLSDDQKKNLLSRVSHMLNPSQIIDADYTDITPVHGE